MIKEYRQQAKGTPDLLNYCLFVAEGVLLLKDGSFCAGFYYRGPDLNSSHPDEISSLAASVNRILLKFGSGWMLHADLIRQRSCNYVLREQCSFPDALSALIDEERREHYLNYGQHYES